MAAQLNEVATEISKNLPSEIAAAVRLFQGADYNYKSRLCGKSWGRGEYAFKCKTCELDRTCVVCIDCFKNGNHEGHDWKMINTSGGCCDCGDIHSWKAEGFCTAHSEPPNSNPLDQLPIGQRDAGQSVMKSVVIHFFKILNSKLNAESQEIISNALKSLEVICIERGDIVRRFVVDAFLDLKSFSEGERNIIDSLFFIEKQLSEGTKGILRSMVYALLPDTKFKEQLAIALLHHYPHLVAADLEDGCGRERNVGSRARETRTIRTEFTVQIFTVKSIAMMLEERHNLLHIMLDCLFKSFHKWVKPEEGYIDVGVIPEIFIGNRLSMDFGYLLQHLEIGERVVTDKANWDRFICTLYTLQGMFPIRRRITTHIEIESQKWIAAQQIDNLMSGQFMPFISAATSSVIAKSLATSGRDATVALCVTILNPVVAALSSWIQHEHDSKKTILPGRVQVCDVSKEKVSFFLPLHRLFSLLCECMATAGLELRNILQPFIAADGVGSAAASGGGGSEKLPLLLRFADHPLRILTVVAQVRKGMWKRNGVEPVGLVDFYANRMTHTIEHDRFLIALASGIGPRSRSDLKSFAVEIFGLRKLLDKTVDLKTLLNILQQDAVLLEDFFSICFVIMLDQNSKNWTKEERVRRWVIQALCVYDAAYSQIEKFLPSTISDERDLILQTLDEVAVFVQPSALKGGYYSLKPQMWQEFEPYFAGYSSAMTQQAFERYEAFCATTSTPQLHSVVPKHALSDPQLKLPLLFADWVLHRLAFVVLRVAGEGNLSSILKLVDISLDIVRASILLAPPSCPPGAQLTDPGTLPSSWDIFSNLCYGGVSSSALSTIATLAKDPAVSVRNRAAAILQAVAVNPSCSLLLEEFNRQKSPGDDSRGEKRDSAAAEAKEILKKRQQQVLSAFAEQQKAFSDKFGGAFDDDLDEDLDQPPDLKSLPCFAELEELGAETQCAICMEKIVHGDGKSGLVSLLNKYGLLAHLSHKFNLENFCEEERGDTMSQIMCGHAMHNACFLQYSATIRRNQIEMEDFASFDLGELPCPLCRRPVNTLTPISIPGARTWAFFNSDIIDKVRLQPLADFIEIIADAPPPAAVEHGPLEIDMIPVSQRLQFNLENMSPALLASHSLVSSLAISDLSLRTGVFGDKSPTAARQDILKKIRRVALMASCVSRSSLSAAPGRIDFDPLIELLSSARSSSAVGPSSTLTDMVLAQSATGFLCRAVLSRRWCVDGAAPIQTFSNIVRLGLALTFARLSRDFSAEIDTTTAGDTLGSYLNLVRPDSTGVVAENLQTATLQFLRHAFLLKTSLWGQSEAEEQILSADPAASVGLEWQNLASEFGIVGLEELLAEAVPGWFGSNVIGGLRQQSEINLETVARACRFKLAPFNFIELQGYFHDEFEIQSRRVCPTCNNRPPIPALCLLCGAIVCSNTSCCQSREQPSSGECFSHAAKCGGGTGIYLMLQGKLSTAIMILRGASRCVWHSIYLDEQGEQDIGLRRGRSLKLQQNRVDLLKHLMVSNLIDYDAVVLQNSTTNAIMF